MLLLAVFTKVNVLNHSAFLRVCLLAGALSLSQILQNWPDAYKGFTQTFNLPIGLADFLNVSTQITFLSCF